eukprot:TRINITY_DN2943_c3_g1_i1.p1 TRINITY_DN2943_c3_g1~~TRINITY_DN2943_c3_g1_i1.p1  ORF type:complete len:472 (+),score=80.87 TRINITY_DN2943_c3_g1_i1:55-1416(+)
MKRWARHSIVGRRAVVKVARYFSRESERIFDGTEHSGEEASEDSLGSVHIVKQRSAESKRQDRKKTVMKVKREKIPVTDKDLWPIHKKTTIYAGTHEQGEAALGAFVFDGKDLPTHVAVRIERRTPSYNQTGSANDFILPEMSALCIGTKTACIVLHTTQWGRVKKWSADAPLLRRLLSSNRIAKLVFSSASIQNSLKKTLALPCSNFIDVSVLAGGLLSDSHVNGVTSFTPMGLSLKDLAATYLKEGLPRPLDVFLSNWNIAPLTDKQLIFSSNHVHAIDKIFTELLRVRHHVKLSGEGPFPFLYVYVDNYLRAFPKPRQDLHNRSKHTFSAGSEFSKSMLAMMKEAFHPLPVRGIWFPCTKQTVCVAFPQQRVAGLQEGDIPSAASIKDANQQFLDAVVEKFLESKSLIVTDSHIGWADAKEEFRLRKSKKKKVRSARLDEEGVADDEWRD